MKPQIIRFALACAVFVLAGCYEDKGNYDYHDEWRKNRDRRTASTYA